MENVLKDRNGNVIMDLDALDKILNKKSVSHNYKRLLTTILDRTTVELNRFNNLKRGIEKDFEIERITGKGREEKLNSLIDETGAHIESLRDEALAIIDEGMDKLRESWKNKTVEAYSDEKLANILAMINNGAVPNAEELEAIIEPYRENPTAVESIRKALDKNGAELPLQFTKETAKERTERLIAQMRHNFSERWHRNAIADLPESIEGINYFLENRVADDLTVSE